MDTTHSVIEMKPINLKNLGQRIAIYPYRKLGVKENLFYISLGLLSVLLPLGYGWYRFQYGYTKYGEIVAHHWGRPWFLLAGFALITSLLLIVHRLRLTNRFVAIHDYGLVLALSSKKAYRWEHLAGISTSVTQHNLLGYLFHPRYYALILPNVGKPIRLNDSYLGLAECISRIKAKLYPRLLPGLQASFQSGQWLYFGPIAVQTQMLRVRNHDFQWALVKSIHVEAGFLVIEWVNQNQKRFRVSDIPNIELLLQFINTGVAV
jgi:hypothetical protein